MANTPNLNFYVVDPNDLTPRVLDVLQATDGMDDTSNIMRIDSYLGQLLAQPVVVESEVEPENLRVGDEWDQIITESSETTE